MGENPFAVNNNNNNNNNKIGIPENSVNRKDSSALLVPLKL
jgi:hypothetical protein